MATKSWREIQETHSKRSPEERAATKSRALRDLVVERMNLAQIRRARTMTQATIADVMEIAQGDVSRLEHRTDAYIGTIRATSKRSAARCASSRSFPMANQSKLPASAISP